MFQPNLLAGKRILVTGGGSGLGLAMASRYAELGADLVLCGRRKEVLDTAVGGIKAKTPGRTVQALSCDIRDPAQVEAMIAEIWNSGPPLSGLVNNAAGNFVARSEELSPRAVDAVLGIVLHGTAYVTLACGKRWVAAAGPAQPVFPQQATVLSIVTTYAWTGSAYVLPSAMAKAGVLAMTRSLAVEWGGKGVRLNAIAPGPFPTPGAWERLVPNPEVGRIMEKKNPLGRTGQHQELANLATYLMADGSAYINGDVVTIDGGEWLKGAGEFNFLEMLTDAEWREMRERGRK